MLLKRCTRWNFLSTPVSPLLDAAVVHCSASDLRISERRRGHGVLLHRSSCQDCGGETASYTTTRRLVYLCHQDTAGVKRPPAPAAATQPWADVGFSATHWCVDKVDWLTATARRRLVPLSPSDMGPVHPTVWLRLGHFLSVKSDRIEFRTHCAYRAKAQRRYAQCLELRMRVIVTLNRHNAFTYALAIKNWTLITTYEAQMVTSSSRFQKENTRRTRLDDIV